MREEHFVEEEIVETKNNISNYNQRLIDKSVKRFNIKKEDRCIIKCFEHWKMWIKMKKLFKYHLELANNKV
jgi:hypothetical protein